MSYFTLLESVANSSFAPQDCSSLKRLARFWVGFCGPQTRPAETHARGGATPATLHPQGTFANGIFFFDGMHYSTKKRGELAQTRQLSSLFGR